MALDYLRPLFHLNRLLVIGFLVRLALIVFGAWQDQNLAVKYTDIDYEVVTDGARFVSEGKSPFLRATYRYTPLLAYLYLGNIYFTKVFGKFLMTCADLLVGYLIAAIMRTMRDRKLVQDSEHARLPDIFFVSLWLFNPFVVNVSTRGNAESVIALLVLATLYFLLNKKYTLAAIIYGLSVHFKIYPIIFSLALFLFIGHRHWLKIRRKMEAAKTPSNASASDSEKTKQQKNKGKVLNPKWLNLFNVAAFRFAFISAGIFIALTAFFYVIYGYQFLYETYLYHLVRQDNRHNFSIYFYGIYLNTANEIIHKASTSTGLTALVEIVLAKLRGLVSFLPQMVLLLVVTRFYYRSIAFCVFLQTFIFVAFNKVCTVQYFIWYFSLLPVVLPYSRIRLMRDGIPLTGLWLFAQFLWLYFAYKLEFLGQNTFFQLFIAGIVYFAVNMYITGHFILYHDNSDTL